VQSFQPARAWVQYEPLGVVGIVAPWNYPLLLTISPLLDAIAAGNRAMLKPSELTPRFSELLRVMIAERYDPSEIAVITGGVENCFTHDRQARKLVLERATSGGVTLNGTLLHIAQDALPFGGVGASGMGAYHGRDGFRRMSHARSVHQIGFINVFERLGPPWGKPASTVARLLSRR
jgi:acyl-CoA reductase-like NAD-dependent aldehyde dehydrogenase